MAAPEKQQETAQDSSPGCLTNVVLYVVALVAMYIVSTPEFTGNFTAAQEQDFHIAAVNLKAGSNEPEYVALSLAQLKSGKVELASLSFLLPRDEISIPIGDIHAVTVLERHADWQLVKYFHGNTHDSVSRYRAYKDRIEPVSYRGSLSMGIAAGAIILLLPVWIVSLLINAVWNAAVRRRKSAHVP